MQSTSSLHHIIGKVIRPVAQRMHHNVASLDDTNVMFNLNSLFGNFSISLLLMVSQGMVV
jgi:hypothetical protein